MAISLETGRRRGGVCITISFSRSITVVKRTKASSGMATETRFVRACVSFAYGSGVVYAA